MLEAKQENRYCEEYFLSKVLNSYVHVFLINGIKIVGDLIGYDSDTLTIKSTRSNQIVLIYKDKVLSVTVE